MSKGAKIWLIVAASLVLFGSIVFVGGIAMMNFNFTEISANKYETNSYEITDRFSSISIVSKTADIVFLPVEDSKCSIECFEQKNMKHSVLVRDGALVIDINDTRKWYEYIGFYFKTQKITVNIPQGEYNDLSIKSDTGNVEIPKELGFGSIDITQSTGKVTNYASASGKIKIKTSTGNINLQNISSSALDLSVSTGKITASGIKCDGEISVNVSTGNTEFSDVKCKSLISSGSTGKISLTNVIAEEKFSIERSTGDIRFEGSDATEIVIATDTGDVKGRLLTDKVFIAKTDTGDIDVPRSVTGGRCEITTDTGDIKITVG